MVILFIDPAYKKVNKYYKFLVLFAFLNTFASLSPWIQYRQPRDNTVFPVILSSEISFSQKNVHHLEIEDRHCLPVIIEPEPEVFEKGAERRRRFG